MAWSRQKRGQRDQGRVDKGGEARAKGKEGSEAGLDWVVITTKGSREEEGQWG